MKRIKKQQDAVVLAPSPTQVERKEAIHSEMNKNIVGDDDVQAFNYFLLGKKQNELEEEKNMNQINQVLKDITLENQQIDRQKISVSTNI